MVPLRTLVMSEEMLLPYPKIYARSTVLSKDRDILAYHFPRLRIAPPYPFPHIRRAEPGRIV